MKRREFVTCLGIGAVATSLRARRSFAARRMIDIGVLMAYDEADLAAQEKLAAFRRGLEAAGGENVLSFRLQTRWATADMDIIRRAAREIVGAAPDIIVSSTARTTIVLSRETTDIPIVFATAADPVRCGFVTSLERPEANITGIRNLDPAGGGRWAEILRQAAPHITQVLLPYSVESIPYAAAFRDAVKTTGVKTVALAVSDMDALDVELHTRAQEPNWGLIPIPDGFMDAHRGAIAVLGARHHLPAISFDRGFTRMGGLLSYGTADGANWRAAARYVDRILKGERLASLPIASPGPFELTVNLKTARALGLNISTELLRRADLVIA